LDVRGESTGILLSRDSHHPVSTTTTTTTGGGGGIVRIGLR